MNEHTTATHIKKNYISIICHECEGEKQKKYGHNRRRQKANQRPKEYTASLMLANKKAKRAHTRTVFDSQRIDTFINIEHQNT